MSQSSQAAFDPAQHVLLESHYFEDLTLGQRLNNPHELWVMPILQPFS